MKMEKDELEILMEMIEIYMGRRKEDVMRKYGYERLEILEEELNEIMMMGVELYIIYEEWERM